MINSKGQEVMTRIIKARPTAMGFKHLQAYEEDIASCSGTATQAGRGVAIPNIRMSDTKAILQKSVFGPGIALGQFCVFRAHMKRKSS